MLLLLFCNKANLGHLFSVDRRTGVIAQRVALDAEAHREPISLQVVARDGAAEGSLSGSTRVVVSVRDVNDHAPLIRIETTDNTGTESDVMSLSVEEGSAEGDFLALVSVEDSDSGSAGRVHCTMPSSHFNLVRVYPNEYKVCPHRQAYQPLP